MLSLRKRSGRQPDPAGLSREGRGDRWPIWDETSQWPVPLNPGPLAAVSPVSGAQPLPGCSLQGPNTLPGSGCPSQPSPPGTEAPRGGPRGPVPAQGVAPLSLGTQRPQRGPNNAANVPPNPGGTLSRASGNSLPSHSPARASRGPGGSRGLGTGWLPFQARRSEKTV